LSRTENQKVHLMVKNQNYWGPGTTIFLTLFVITIYFFLQSGTSFVLINYTGIQAPPTHEMLLAGRIPISGLVLSLSILLAAPCCIGLIIYFIMSRKGLSLKDYLGLKRPEVKKLFKWLVLLILTTVSFELLSRFLDKQVVSEEMIDAFKSAGSLSVFCAAVVIIGPLFEEVLFRGFAFEGIRNSRLGPLGAVLITSFLWSVIHFQYDWYGMLNIFVLGLLFGIARLRTDSLIVTVVIHWVNNLASTVEMMLKVHYTS
jgi:membrane protease YdiL (CAAX protease family)